MSSGANDQTSTTSSESGCFIAPPWYPINHSNLWDFPFLLMQLQLVVVFVLTQGLHHLLFKHLGLPPLVSQLMAGILLSPAAFIAKFPIIERFHEFIFPEISDPVWQTLATLGLSLSLFVMGVKMDVTMIKSTGRKAVTIGLLVLSLPVVNNVVATMYGHWSHLDENKFHMAELRACVATLSLTPFPVIAILLGDLNLLNSELGRLALSIAIISELGSVATIVVSNISSNVANTSVVVALILFVIFIFRPLMNQIIKQTPKGKHVKYDYVLLAFMIMLVAAMLTDITGNLVMLGSFIVGAAIPEGPPLGSSIVLKLDTFVLRMLQPFFISTCAMRANVFAVEFHHKLIHGEILISLSSFLTKIAICLACALYYNMSISDALALAAILSSKGIVDISLYNMFNQTNMIQDSSFAYLILLTTIVAFIIPVAIKSLYHPLRKYAGYQKRDIMHHRNDAPLRILACINRPDNVSALITLLRLSNITHEDPMIVDAVHLIKLVGRSQPVFVSHDLQHKKVSNNTTSYSDEVMWALDKFQKEKMSSLSMHLYTIVSPPSAMHENVCTLALDKLSSIIIMPFHQKINIHGTIEFVDHTQRVLNCNILDRSPCSVGILIDKGYSRLQKSRSSISRNKAKATTGSDGLASLQMQGSDEEDMQLVAVIFIGGSDDREAVAYAKRMAKGARVKVLVIRIIALGDSTRLPLLDISAISLIQQYSSRNPQFKYMEKVVREGAETAQLLQSMVGDFDLIIVGRRYDMDCPQTSDLKQWGKVPELGILGDLLASPDFKSRTSILVIQQQKQWTLSED